MQKKAPEEELIAAAPAPALGKHSSRTNATEISRAGLVTAAGAAFLIGVFFGVAGTLLFFG